MGGIKRELAHKEALQEIARVIALESGFVVECDDHPGVQFEGGEDIEEAYRLAEEKIEAGSISNIERRDLHYAIEQLSLEEVVASCPQCDKRDSE